MNKVAAMCMAAQHALPAHQTEKGDFQVKTASILATAILASSLLLNTQAHAASFSDSTRASRANDGLVVTDIVLVASNAGGVPAGPTGYQLVGYWDVDAGGSQGTSGIAGEWNMAMYALRQLPSRTANCVVGVGILATNNGSVDGFIPPAWYYRGMWDVDDGGGRGNLGSGDHGEYMMGLYTRHDTSSSGRCVRDISLYASNSPWEYTPPGYVFAGSWDVDDGGGRGSDGSSGEWQMTLSTLSQ